MAGDAAIMQPTYAAQFQCIGPACEDPCCSEFDIPVDKATYERYREFPSQKLGDIVADFVSINAPGSPSGLYAQINRARSGNCPFYGADRLCEIHQQYGQQLLPATCSIYPRFLSLVDDRLEGSLSLSCPEAARNVLLNPEFMLVRGELSEGKFRTDNFYHLLPPSGRGVYKPYLSFFRIRTLLIELVRDRSRSLWQRLFLIGIVCQRLEGIREADERESVSALVDEFRHVIDQQLLREELEGLHGTTTTRLKVVIALSSERVSDPDCSDRFRRVFQAFMEGSGCGDGSVDDAAAARFVEVARELVDPLMEEAPFLLENYLLNYMLQHLFSFGLEGSAQSTPQGMFDEYMMMATQFSWMNALLTGVAGSVGKAFCAAHVVEVVQSLTRAVEHYPLVRRQITDSMKRLGLNSLEGVVVLLKNEV